MKLNSAFNPRSHKNVARMLGELNGDPKPDAFVMLYSFKKSRVIEDFGMSTMGVIAAVVPCLQKTEAFAKDTTLVSGKWPLRGRLVPLAQTIEYLSSNSGGKQHFVIIGDGVVKDSAAALKSLDALLGKTGLSLDFCVMGCAPEKTPLQKLAETLAEKHPGAVTFTKDNFYCQGHEKLIEIVNQRHTAGRVTVDYKRNEIPYKYTRR